MYDWPEINFDDKNILASPSRVFEAQVIVNSLTDWTNDIVRHFDVDICMLEQFAHGTIETVKSKLHGTVRRP